MADNQQRINTLYGGGGDSAGESNTAADTGDSEGSKTADHINTLYGETGETEAAEEPKKGNPYATDPGSTLDQLYGGSDTVKLPDDLDLTGVTANDTEAATLRENLGYMAATAGASAADVSELVRAAGEHSGRAQTQEQRNQIMNDVLAEHGGRRQVLEDAIDLCASYPEWYEWLSRTGAGDDPKIINAMIRLSRTSRGQARIRAYRGK